MLDTAELNGWILMNNTKDLDDISLFPGVCVVEDVVAWKFEPLNFCLALFHHTISRWLGFVELIQETFFLNGLWRAHFKRQIWKDHVVLCYAEIVDHALGSYLDDLFAQFSMSVFVDD